MESEKFRQQGGKVRERERDANHTNQAKMHSIATYLRALGDVNNPQGFESKRFQSTV